MITALDTNVLVRHATPTDPARATVIRAVGVLRAAGHDLRLVPQNLYEFWAVATRPVPQNGLGLSAAECDQTLAAFEGMFPLLPDTPALTTEWRAVVTAHGCLGKVAHDARPVAAMNTHGIKHLVTFNLTDFRRYTHITLHDPHVVAATLPLPPSAGS